MLEVKKINVYYGPMQCLWDVSFKVNKGEIVAILGPNSAGKTTTLRSISGLVRIKSGTIIFMNYVINKMSPHKIVRLGISHVPEGRWLFPYMTVEENLKIGAYTTEARKKVKETLEEIYQLFPMLKERRNQMAQTLSGGEQQILAIARGLMLRPKLLILDEPSQGLAPRIIMEIFNFIKKIHEEEGVTVLLAEQYVEETLKLADRAYVLENGHIVLEGSGEQLLRSDLIKKAYFGA